VFATAAFAPHQPAPAASQPADPAQQEQKATNPSAAEKPKVKTGEIKENQRYESGIPAIEVLHSVAFATPQSGWAVGNAGVILHTADGGQTWKTQSSGTSGDLLSVAFGTPQSGWAVGRDGVILHTADGGQTWKTQSSGTSVWLLSVAFATPQSVWAVGGSGTIVHTEDGGQTWKSQTSGTRMPLSAVTFATAESGWAVSPLVSRLGGIILHTEDGGQTWKAQSISSRASLLFVTFATPQSGWAGGSEGTILHTEDGGQTWKAQTSGSDGVLNSVAFATPHSGWVVGTDGTILHTNDGGKTWKKQASGSDTWLTSVAFATPQSGWAAGEGGIILHTVDGGQTWVKQAGPAEQPPPKGSENTGVADPSSRAQDPKVKTGEIKENQRYKSGRGMFSVTVPAAGNPFVRTYKLRESQLKDENFDYEEVVFHIDDFGQAYGAGVRRIPQAVLAQMTKEEEKQTLSNLANKALFQWRDDYAEEPQPVEEFSVQTQFGAGLLRIYLAKGSSLLGRVAGSDQAGKPKVEKFDAYIAVLVVKKDNLFIYATAEDDFLQNRSTLRPPGARFDPKPVLTKALQSFFASMTVKF
jgi:photosystem II stability/assembly factor-like uncharacterized protein